MCFLISATVQLLHFHKMNGDINFRFVFKLCAIIFVVAFNSNRVQHGIVAVAQILVEPRWDANASQCFVDTNTTGGIHVLGSAMETCSLHTIASQGTHIQLLIPGRNRFQEPEFLYVERERDLDNCLHKYVVFNEQIEICSSMFNHQKKVEIIIQGNFDLYVMEIPETETLPKCPEDDVIRDSKRVG